MPGLASANALIAETGTMAMDANAATAVALRALCCNVNFFLSENGPSAAPDYTRRTSAATASQARAASFSEETYAEAATAAVVPSPTAVAICLVS